MKDLVRRVSTSALWQAIRDDDVPLTVGVVGVAIPLGSDLFAVGSISASNNAIAEVLSEAGKQELVTALSSVVLR